VRSCAICNARGRPTTKCHDYISDLAWSRLGVEIAEVLATTNNHEVFRDVLWVYRPSDPPEKKIGKEKENE